MEVIEWIGVENEDAHVIAVQEHRLVETSRLVAAASWAKKRGYKLSAPKADKTGIDARATSAGVGLLVGMHLGVSKAPMPHEHKQSRITAVEVDVGCDAPLSFVSFYGLTGFRFRRNLPYLETWHLICSA